ncbi:LamG domain-containing protein [Candidatus Poribacteria bacterium]|nr:LamG domain-containing protein [Candidatus Poribacteria bacterium]
MRSTAWTLLYAAYLVFAVSTAHAKITPDSLVGLWYFDEGKGDTTADSSPNAFQGAIKGARWEDGKLGKALNFAKGDTVTFTLGKGTLRTSWSVAMWIKFTDLAGQQNYFSVWDQSDNRSVPYKTDGNELRFWSNLWNVGSSFNVSSKTWYHVANVYDGKNAAIYIDGAQKVSQAVAAFILQDQNQTAWVATDKGIGFLTACVVDEVGLFKVGLEAGDVKSIMESGLGRATGLEPVEPRGKLARTWGIIKVEASGLSG